MARGYNPLAPIGPRALRRQAVADVRAQTVPLARELTRQINAAAAAGAANITGVSNQLAATLGSQQGAQRDIYERARGNLGAVNTEQAQALGLASDQLTSGLAARLASAGAPPDLANSLAASLKGAQGAGFARGSADVNQLTANQAGAESYAAKLPGLAQLAGLQGVSERRAQGQKDLATQLGALNAKVPGLIAQELQGLNQQEYNKAVARLGFGEKAYSVNAQNARTNQTNQTRLTVAEIQSRDRNRAISAANKRSGMNLAERARHNGVTEAQQAKKDQQNYKIQSKNAATSRMNAKTSRKRANKSSGSVTGLGK